MLPAQTATEQAPKTGDLGLSANEMAVLGRLRSEHPELDTGVAPSS